MIGMAGDRRPDPPRKVFVRPVAPVDDAEALRLGYELFEALGAAAEQEQQASAADRVDRPTADF